MRETSSLGPTTARKGILSSQCTQLNNDHSSWSGPFCVAGARGFLSCEGRGGGGGRGGNYRIVEERERNHSQAAAVRKDTAVDPGEYMRRRGRGGG